ncbi:MAG: CRISPR-associated helicase Cas3' [Alicyclobacillus sp.]|nr:CRISPR-associated helicase Cas3' [Alicyclobacillus sp.]
MFQRATGFAPYDYQCRLARQPGWPRVVRVPTGAGKTAAILLAWVWKSLYSPEEVRRCTPGRLIYCLPQRTLVQQTEAAARAWIDRLNLADQLQVHVLMGGHIADGWETCPGQRQILIGTQDQLLSRALNRGYGMSRYRWPMHFALLNNDALWVVDEPQLFGDALATTAQLQAFREQYGTYGPTATVWLSATVEPGWLRTVDAAQLMDGADVIELSRQDESQLAERLDAPKPLQASGIRLSAKDADRPAEYASTLARYVQSVHHKGSLTLVIVNRVGRAQLVYQALKQLRAATEIRLIHSRFRGVERKLLQQDLERLETADAILVSTQAVEAGVNLSAERLVTELAPWTSLVQRFGRCNRNGRAANPSVHWVDLEEDPKACTPYTPEDLETSRNHLRQLTDVGIRSLPTGNQRVRYRNVLRRRDLLNLFDTSPDLTGFDVDVSPYVRDAEDTDVTVFWRLWEGPAPGPDQSRPGPDEVCHVSLRMIREYLDARRDKDKDTRRCVWVWDPLRSRWHPVDSAHDIVPGQTLLLDARLGGYSSELGFHPASWEEVTVWQSAGADGGTQSFAADSHDGDSDNAPVAGGVVTLGQHLLDVAEEARKLAAQWPDVEEFSTLEEAALHHDRGKAHPLFQARIWSSLPAGFPAPAGELLAKSPFPSPRSVSLSPSSRRDGEAAQVTSSGSPSEGILEQAAASQGERIAERSEYSPAARTEQRSSSGFRHELASALAFLQDHAAEQQNDLRVRLIAYLIAAHHGKVRMYIQSVPTEPVPEDGRLFARGVWDGDDLPPIQLPDGSALPAATLRLSVMRTGTDPTPSREPVPDSWVMGVQRLLDQYGPFRLAWLETALRIADWRASEKEVISRELGH